MSEPGKFLETAEEASMKLSQEGFLVSMAKGDQRDFRSTTKSEKTT